VTISPTHIGLFRILEQFNAQLKILRNQFGLSVTTQMINLSLLLVSGNNPFDAQYDCIAQLL
jgi:hypothetical protein